MPANVPDVQKRLGQILIEKGFVTREQVDLALSIQVSEPNRRLGDILTSIGAACGEKVYSTLADVLGYQFVDLTNMKIQKKVIGAIPEAIAHKHQVLPISEEGDGRLVVAISDPLDLYTVDNLRFYLGREVKIVLAVPGEIKRLILKYYGEYTEHTGFVETLPSEDDEKHLLSREDREERKLVRLLGEVLVLRALLMKRRIKTPSWKRELRLSKRRMMNHLRTRR